MTALLDLATWVPILDGDPVAAATYAGHYSSSKSRERRARRGTLQFGGNGSRMILSTPCRGALFGWRRQKFRFDGQAGIECFIFSNKTETLSSELIAAADLIADQRWPGERHFTFINPDETDSRRGSKSLPGQCFIHAGWNVSVRKCGAWMMAATSKRGLWILERSAI